MAAHVSQCASLHGVTLSRSGRHCSYKNGSIHDTLANLVSSLSTEIITESLRNHYINIATAA